MTALEPDRDQIEIFVDAIFRRATAQGFVSLRSFVEGQNKPLITAISFHGDRRFQFLADKAETYARTAAQAESRVVFCPPLALFNNRKTAKEADIAEGLALSIECDRHPRQARGKLQEVLGLPTLVVVSGGVWLNGGAPEDKLHLHWRLAKPAKGADALAKLKEARRLATLLVGGDASNVPACHPIRWPGSWHRKGEPRLCAIETALPDCEINLDAALASLQAAAPPEQARPQGNPTEGGDWRTLVAAILSAESYHEPLVRLAAMYVAAGMQDGAIVNQLRAFMELSTGPRDVRWQLRFDDIPRDVSTARAKFDRPEPPPTNVFDPWQQYVVPDFPVDILPPVARDFVCAQSEIIGCDVAGLAMSVLATFSGALHHGHALRMLRNGSWWASPRLWILLVGPPSSKKTPTFNAATDPLLKYECGLRRKYEQELRDFEKAQEAGDESWPEPEKPPRYISWDSTVEKLGEILARDTKGILVKSDELSGWLSNMERYSNSAGRSDRAFWLQAYDGGPHAVDRIKRGELFIENLSVSIIGGLQPERLAEIRQGLSSDGLLQRFLPVMLRSPSFRVDTPHLDEDYIKLVCALIFVEPQRLIMTDDALVVMTDLHKHLFELEQLSGGLAAGFDSFVGKLAGVCGTLALILHLAHDPKDGPTRPVGERTVEDVRRLMFDFILPHALEFYRGTASTAGDRLRRIAGWILTSGATRVLASDLTRKVRDCRGLGLVDVNKAVAPLVATGWLKAADNTPVCKSWEVEPLVHIKLADRARIEKERRGALAKLLRRRG